MKLRKSMLIVAGMLSAFSLFACATVLEYAEPTSGTTATLTVLSEGAHQASMYTCNAERTDVVLFGVIGSGGLQNFRAPEARIVRHIPTDQELRLAVGYKQQYGGAGSNFLGSDECLVLLAFRPVPGAEYEADWKTEHGQCSLNIYQLQAAEAGKSATRVPIEARPLTIPYCNT